MKPKRIFAAAKNGNNLEIMLYDQIGGGLFSEGVTAKDVADQIKTAGKVSAINIRINSPGGNVFEGTAIYNLLVSQGVPINVMVDGIAASIASVIAMAGTTITMGENAMMMIHNPHALAMGEAKDMRSMADTLDKVKESMLTSYMRKYKNNQDRMIAVMDAETWFTAKDCIECGLANKILTPENTDQAQALAASFDWSQFKNVPDSLKKAQGDMTACPCSCNPCELGNCDECNNVNCTFDCPDCPMQAAGNAPGPDNPAGKTAAEVKAEQEKATEKAAELVEVEAAHAHYHRRDRLNQIGVTL